MLTDTFVSGKAEVLTGHVTRLSTDSQGRVLAELDQTNKATEERSYDYVINCTGPNTCEPCYWTQDCRDPSSIVFQLAWSWVICPASQGLQKDGPSLEAGLRIEVDLCWLLPAQYPLLICGQSPPLTTSEFGQFEL